MQLALKIASEDNRAGVKDGRNWAMTILTALDGSNEQPKCGTVFEIVLSDSDKDLKGKLENQTLLFNASRISAGREGKMRLDGRFVREAAPKK